MPRHGIALLLLFLRQLRLSTCRLFPSWLSVRCLCTLWVLSSLSRVSPSALLVFLSVCLAVHVGGFGLRGLFRVWTLFLLIPLRMKEREEQESRRRHESRARENPESAQTAHRQPRWQEATSGQAHLPQEEQKEGTPVPWHLTHLE